MYVFVNEMPLLQLRCNLYKSVFLMYDKKTDMPKEGRLSLDFFVIGESTPSSRCMNSLIVGGSVFIFLFFEKSWF